MSTFRPVEVKQDVMESRKQAAIIPIDSAEEIRCFAPSRRNTLDEMVSKLIEELEVGMLFYYR